MTLTCGIDEAGRGPVIGPLVTCGVVLDEEGEKMLKELGVKDSKLILPKKREQLMEHIIKIAKSYEVVILSPKEIDAALADPGTNLNWLEADTTAKIINTLKPERAIVDCPSNNIKAYTDYLRRKLNVECELVVEHKADLNHIPAAAGSIIAKVTRDREIDKIKQKVGKDIGSGYPADPITKEFLQKNYDKYPGIFRKSWQTYKNVIAKKQQKELGDF
ncbi:MAG: ribonuclease HII [Candidatus Woesearchaeota archaeon]